MYDELLDDELRPLFRSASAEVSLETEIRLMRARIAKGLSTRDDKSVDAACAMLVRLVRAQAAVGGESDLNRLLAEVGEAIVARAERSEGAASPSAPHDEEEPRT